MSKREAAFAEMGQMTDFRLATAVKPRKALITAPTFAEYRAAMELQGTEIEEFELKEIDGFSLTEEFY